MSHFFFHFTRIVMNFAMNRIASNLKTFVLIKSVNGDKVGVCSNEEALELSE